MLTEKTSVGCTPVCRRKTSSTPLPLPTAMLSPAVCHLAKKIYKSTLKETAEIPIADTKFNAFDAFIRCNEDGSAHVAHLVTVCIYVGRTY